MKKELDLVKKELFEAKKVIANFSEIHKEYHTLSESVNKLKGMIVEKESNKLNNSERIAIFENRKITKFKEEKPYSRCLNESQLKSLYESGDTVIGNIENVLGKNTKNEISYNNLYEAISLVSEDLAMSILLQN